LITVRFFAGAKSAAGMAQQSAPEGLDLERLLKQLTADHGAGLGRVLLSASFLVDGLAWHDHRAPLPAGATVDVLPPFAGG
jgi:sulfur-carrier protein